MRFYCMVNWERAIVLTEQVVLVTGAGRGIGRAIALAFAEAGCNVACLARTLSEIEATATAVRERGQKAIPIQCDITEKGAVDEAFARAAATLGPIDILVNNAGYLVIRSIAETSVEDFDRTLAVNLRGVYLCTKAVLPAMMERKHGTIINIASTSSKRWYVGQGAYCAAKHGVLGFTKVLAEELREYNIRVSAICPGGVDTRLVREQRDDIIAGEWMDPEDVARVAVFLATLPPKAAIDEVVIRRFKASPLHS
ncbi:MAG: SDR family NAD(P)-dependent oxidoreductase [Candidatus Zipacnadales bacterium]